MNTWARLKRAALLIALTTCMVMSAFLIAAVLFMAIPAVFSAVCRF